jgi:hypothetical protein
LCGESGADWWKMAGIYPPPGGVTDTGVLDRCGSLAVMLPGCRDSASHDSVSLSVALLREVRSLQPEVLFQSVRVVGVGIGRVFW